MRRNYEDYVKEMQRDEEINKIMNSDLSSAEKNEMVNKIIANTSNENLSGNNGPSTYAPSISPMQQPGKQDPWAVKPRGPKKPRGRSTTYVQYPYGQPYGQPYAVPYNPGLTAEEEWENMREDRNAKKKQRTANKNAFWEKVDPESKPVRCPLFTLSYEKKLDIGFESKMADGGVMANLVFIPSESEDVRKFLSANTGRPTFTVWNFGVKLTNKGKNDIKVKWRKGTFLDPNGSSNYGLQYATIDGFSNYRTVRAGGYAPINVKGYFIETQNLATGALKDISSATTLTTNPITTQIPARALPRGALSVRHHILCLTVQADKWADLGIDVTVFCGIK